MSYNEPKTQPKVGTAERVIYHQADIKITNLRAVFGAKTYSISNITSVEAQRIDASGCGPLFLGLTGFMIFLFGVSSATGRRGDAGDIVTIIVGIAFLAFAAYVSRTAKPSFAVTLTTAAGEVKAYTSLDETTIREIVAALNNAIIQKG